MMKKISDDEAKSLYQIAQKEGWDSLDTIEARAARRWAKKRQPSPEATASTPTPTRTRQPVHAASVDRYMLLDEWPESTMKSSHRKRRSKYDEPARIARETGRILRIKQGLTKSQAISLATMVRRGRRVSFKPAGSFDARKGQDANGTYSVYIKYVGKETK